VTKTTGSPFIGFWGVEAECTPKSRCDELLSVIETGGSFVHSRWFTGAAYGWNGTKPAKFYKGVPNFSPCDFQIYGNGLVTEATAALTADSDKKLIENSEHCVDFGYTIGRHEKPMS
jgi:hypothetical protein